MKPKENKVFFDGKLNIKVNSMYPAGQGYAPRIIEETHYNIYLNGHNINITESAFNELLRIIEPFEDKVVIEKVEDNIMSTHSESEILSNLQIRYKEKFKKELPPRYKNDIQWIDKALGI